MFIRNLLSAALANLHGCTIHRRVETLRERVHTGQRQPVEYLQTAFLILKNSSCFEHCQVPGYGGPAGTDCIHEVTNATLTVSQRLDNLQPRRMAECLENGGARFTLFSGDFPHGSEHISRFSEIAISYFLTRYLFASVDVWLSHARARGMNVGEITFRPIGFIRSLHTDPGATPIQPVYANDCVGRLEIFQEFAEGLADIDGFSHIYLFYHLHRALAPQLRVKPFLQDVEHGIFATRAPCRPNPLGMSLVQLLRREDNVLHLSGVDILDGTPLLDIKPYSSRFDAVENPRGGWTDDVSDTEAQARGRRDFKV